MAKFTVDKKGYNIEQVDSYLDNIYLKYEDRLAEQKDRVVSLRNEVDNLNVKLASYVDKEEQISKALIFAVEKAEQIEANAKNVYNMEIKRVNALYSRWEDLLLEIEKECPKLNRNNYINSLMSEFKKQIEEVSESGLKFETKSLKTELKQKSNQFVRNILNKMDYVVNKPYNVIVEDKPEKEVAKKVKQEKKQPKQISNIQDRLQKIIPLQKKNINLNTESMAEKYLNSDEDVQINAYSKNFAKKKLEKNGLPFDFPDYPEPNESGFDLKEALNPKEDLDEIMKSFDFFDED